MTFELRTAFGMIFPPMVPQNEGRRINFLAVFAGQHFPLYVGFFVTGPVVGMKLRKCLKISCTFIVVFVIVVSLTVVNVAVAVIFIC